MGIYDTLDDGGREAQVKCFKHPSLRRILKGGLVPELVTLTCPTCGQYDRKLRPADPVSYSIAAEEPYWANINDGRFIGLAETPMFEEKLDYWGGRLGPGDDPWRD